MTGMMGFVYRRFNGEAFPDLDFSNSLSHSIIYNDNSKKNIDSLNFCRAV